MGRRTLACAAAFAAAACCLAPDVARAFSISPATSSHSRQTGRRVAPTTSTRTSGGFGVVVSRLCAVAETDTATTTATTATATTTRLPRRRSDVGGFERSLERQQAAPAEEQTRGAPVVVIEPDAQGVRMSDEFIVMASSAAEERQVGEEEDLAFKSEGAEASGDAHTEDEAPPTADEAAREKRRAAAALLRRNNGGGRRAVSGARSARTTTSVGAIRKGAASRAGRSATGSILGTVRTAARVAVAAGGKKADEDDAAEAAAGNATNAELTDASSPGGTKARNDGAAGGSGSAAGIATKTVIQSTINDLLSKQNNEQNQGGVDDDGSVSASFSPPQQPSMGLFGEPDQYGPHMPPAVQFRNPFPGSILVHPNYDVIAEHDDHYDHDAEPADVNIKEHTAVRVATPSDDPDIAMLRLSVFSDFSPDLRRKFCSRSCEVLASRRNRHGATCLVASVDRSRRVDILKRNGIPGAESYAEKDPALGALEWIIGSAECSVHEFHGTALGERRLGGSLLYVTEVAVWPHARRCGAGALLMEGVAELAAIRQVETIYLHVDVTNDVACALYERAGYEYASKSDPLYHQFTESLNLHDGATKGRNHHLLYKHLTPEGPTWLLEVEQEREPENERILREEEEEALAPSEEEVLGAILGFEVY